MAQPCGSAFREGPLFINFRARILNGSNILLQGSLAKVRTRSLIIIDVVLPSGPGKSCL